MDKIIKKDSERKIGDLFLIREEGADIFTLNLKIGNLELESDRVTGPLLENSRFSDLMLQLLRTFKKVK